MTEIPEHLLKRSRDRRAALGLGGGEAPPSGEAAAEAAPATSPATTAAAAPAAAPPAGPAGRRPGPAPIEVPPKPDPPYVAAAKRRAKIPIWAMAALSLMPIWAFMYVRSLTEAPQTVEGPMAIGDEVYSNCASCHGGAGEGGTGRPLANGEVNKTFPHIEDQLRFVYFGTEGYNSAGVSIYGDPNREGGAHTAGSFGLMPAWGTNAGGDLTDAEILGVVCHERYAFGVDPAADAATAKEFGLWCAENSPMLAALDAGTPIADLDEAGITGPDGAPVEIIDIGDKPAEGHSPSGTGPPPPPPTH